MSTQFTFMTAKQCSKTFFVLLLKTYPLRILQSHHIQFWELLNASQDMQPMVVSGQCRHMSLRPDPPQCNFTMIVFIIRHIHAIVFPFLIAFGYLFYHGSEKISFLAYRQFYSCEWQHIKIDHRVLDCHPSR